MIILYLFFSFILGLLIGSFLNVVIYRLPREENIAFPPSHCPNCNHKISPLENIPVLSYIFLKGKCSVCMNRISIRYPLIELLTGVMFSLVYCVFGFLAEAFIYIAFVSLLIAVFFIDLEHYIISDSLLAGILILAIVRIAFLKEPGWLNALISSVVVFIVFFLVFIFSNEKFGGGDVKLFTVLSLFFGWPFVNILIILASIMGILVGGSLILIGKMKRDEPIPFGPFIVISAIIIIFFGESIWTIYENTVMALLL